MLLIAFWTTDMPMDPAHYGAHVARLASIMPAKRANATNPAAAYLMPVLAKLRATGAAALPAVASFVEEQGPLRLLSSVKNIDKLKRIAQLTNSSDA
jgi:hypothetical protein